VLDSRRQEHSEGERPQSWDGPFVRRALEASLRRLRTDHLDLYQLHNPRLEAIDSDECFATLEELRTEGKIAQYGVALGPAIGWREEGLRAISRRQIASVQTVYNLLEQDPGRDFIAAATNHGVGPDFVGAARRQPDARDELRPRRPPPPPAARVAGRGSREDRANPLPLRPGDGAHDGPGGASLHPRPASDDRRNPDDHQPG
jgi:hypothetical protein